MKANWKKGLKEKRIEKCSSIIKWYLPQIYQPNEFMVAHFILEKMNMNKCHRVKLYVAQLADWCNLSERQIKRITSSINDKGIIKKELIGDAENKKTYNIYCIDWQKTEEFLARFDTKCESFLPDLTQNEEFLDKIVPLKDTKDNKENKDNKDNKENKELEVIMSEDDEGEDFGLPF